MNNQGSVQANLLLKMNWLLRILLTAAQENQQHLAYAATSFAASVLDSVFMFYYVKVFLNLYHVSEAWFQTAQILFLIWNMLNDPLFAYAQDHYNMGFNRYRREIILYGAPIFALAFLTTWFPWVDVEDGKSHFLIGFQLIFVLYVYDLLYTAILLTHGCIHTEISTDSHDRIKRQQFANAASLLGSISVLLCEYFSEGLLEYTKFQATCAVLAVIAWLCMTYTGLHCNTKYEIKHMESAQSSGVPIDRKTNFSICTLTLQLLKNRNFFLFVIVNFLAEFHRTFLGSFTVIFSDALLPKISMSSTGRSIYFGALLAVPRILLTFGGPILKRFGYYQIYQVTMVTKIIFGLALYFFGSITIVSYMTFVMLDSIMCGLGIGMMGLALPDLIDEDAGIYQRKHPLSAMVYGTNALVTKPANSLAPMMVVHLLNTHGYATWQSNGGSLVQAPPEGLTSVMFIMACFVPVVIGTFQLILWRFYTIRKSHLVRSNVSGPLNL